MTQMVLLGRKSSRKSLLFNRAQQLRPGHVKRVWRTHLNYSLNSLKGVIWGYIYGTTLRAIKGDTRSLDCSSYAPAHPR